MNRATMIAAMLALAALSACEERKTVHVKRGSAMLGLEGNVGDEKILEDGTRVIVVGDLPSNKKASAAHDGYAIRRIEPAEPPLPATGFYSNPGPPAAARVNPKEAPPKDFQVREETKSGEVILRAIMPEHVMAHLLDALKSEDYGALYAQMLADETRRAYDHAGGEATFVAWATANREPLLIFLNRMGSNWSGTEVMTEQVTPSRLRYRLDRRTIPNMRFEVIEVTMEHGGCRLAMVR
ncbi:MAG: hypothetical protein EXS17_06220 [Phycisphaerales bacterium]|nr:hypothetical protein [Phycisphaerales bacterium]